MGNEILSGNGASSGDDRAFAPSASSPQAVSPVPASIPSAADWSPLSELEAVADEAFARWDKDMRSGKLLLALSGDLPRYRKDITSIRLACSVAPGLLSTIQAVNILARREGNVALVDVDTILRNIRDLTSQDNLARMFAEMPASGMQLRENSRSEVEAEGLQPDPKGTPKPQGFQHHDQ